jgi:Arc/MetJ-type ribon-helix-helix transcriptional regulator
MPADVTKVTVNLPTEVVEQLRKLVATGGIKTMTDAISQSIKINSYLTEQEQAGSKLLIETPDRKIQQIIRK